MTDMTPDRSRKKSVRHTLHAVASIDDAIADMVTGLIADGYTWAQVARPLGVTRQEAHRRYRPRAGSRDTGGAA